MSERLRRVVGRFDIQPGDRVLEIGFDKVFAVRVGLFHREPARARALAERWLAPGGTLLAVFDEPG